MAAEEDEEGQHGQERQGEIDGTASQGGVDALESLCLVVLVEHVGELSFCHLHYLLVHVGQHGDQDVEQDYHDEERGQQLEGVVLLQLPGMRAASDVLQGDQADHAERGGHFGEDTPHDALLGRHHFFEEQVETEAQHDQDRE